PTTHRRPGTGAGSALGLLWAGSCAAAGSSPRHRTYREKTVRAAYSHSMVAGGLLVMSRKTASTPSSCKTLLLIVLSNRAGRLAKFAVIPSTELTGRRMMLSPF